jgi:hypothetical protein
MQWMLCLMIWDWLLSSYGSMFTLLVRCPSF